MGTRALPVAESCSEGWMYTRRNVVAPVAGSWTGWAKTTLSRYAT